MMAWIRIHRQALQRYIETYVMPDDPHARPLYTGDLRSMDAVVIHDMLILSDKERRHWCYDEATECVLLETDNPQHFQDMGGECLHESA